MKHFSIISYAKKCCILVFFVISLLGNAQRNYKNIQIPPVNKFSGKDECEPSIAINPLNKDEIAAGSVLKGYHFSKDGGKTWKSTGMKSPYGVYGDPVLTYDYKGRLYYFHLSDYKQTSWLDRIVCQTTDKIDGPFNNGTFPKPNGNKVQDKQWVVVHPKTNVVYMTWTQFDAYNSKKVKDSSFIMFSKSIDRGQSWTDPIRISKFGGDCLDGDNTVEGAVPALGLNGEVYVTWTGPKGLVLQKSSDDGKTWLKEEKIIAEHPGGWEFTIPGIYRANGLPFLVSDMSDGPNRGTLYLNWADQINGVEDTDIWLMTSKDGGETWTNASRVNQDKSKSHQFFTCMTIDQTNGNLHFVFYDRSNYQTGAFQTDVAWCISRDGGKTFQQSIISKKPFVPNSTVFFGDYLGISVVQNRIRPIWPRMDDGKITLWTALIDLRK